ncbi:serine/threonine protein kinase [Novipirellula rosea]|uniref:Protein kinase domain-containing protein n=1 Tax=Novipirellula rosea TaxID=1031540 RepID=A0ABP8NRJ4_9BACT
MTPRDYDYDSLTLCDDVVGANDALACFPSWHLEHYLRLSKKVNFAVAILARAWSASLYFQRLATVATVGVDALHPIHGTGDFVHRQFRAPAISCTGDSDTFHCFRGDLLAIELQTECPACESSAQIDASLIGKKVGCPTCQRLFYANRARPVAAGNQLAAVLTRPSTTSAEHRPVASVQGSPVTALPASNDVSKLPQQLGRYQLDRVIGEGAFGTVWLCRDTHTSRSVALKLPHFESRDKKRAARFITEARAAAALRHPNIVAVLNAGRVGGQHFIATEYVPGPTLDEFAATKMPSQREAAECIRKLALALDYAHRHEIVHRDVKPLNIIIDSKGEPQLLDFGLAKRLDFDSALTIDGSVLGTPAYMPPEQARGDIAAIGPATDQYSLAACLYFLLTGQSPFSGNSAAVLQMAIHSAPTPILQLNPQVDLNLVAICQRAMAYEPAKRYASCGEFAHELKLFLHDLPVRARPLSVRERFSGWCRRNPAEAKFAAAVAVVLLFGVLISSIGWLSARRTMAEATEREQDAAALVQQRQQVQTDLQRRLREIETATRRAQAAQAMAEKQRATFEYESLQLNQAIQQTQRNTALVIQTTESLKAEETKIAELHQEIAGTATTVSETKQALVAMRLRSEADQLLKERLQGVRHAIESESFEEARRKLNEIPESLQGWETGVLSSLVDQRQAKIKVHTIDLSLLGNDFGTPEWHLVATDSPDKFLLFQAAQSTTKLLMIDFASASAVDIGEIGSVNDVCFSEQLGSLTLASAGRIPRWTTVANQQPFEELLYAVSPPANSLWSIDQMIVHPRHGTVYAAVSVSNPYELLQSGSAVNYRVAARLQRIKRAEEQRKLEGPLIDRHANEWFDTFRLMRMNGDKPGVIWERYNDASVRRSLQRFLNDRSQAWGSAEIDRIETPSICDVYSESGKHHLAIMASYQIGLRTRPRPGLPVKAPHNEIMTIMVPISNRDPNTILPTKVFVTSQDWWTLNRGQIGASSLSLRERSGSSRSTWIVPSEISEPMTEDAGVLATRNRIGSSVLVVDSATINRLRGPLVWQSEIPIHRFAPTLRWVTCYADEGELMFGEVGKDDFHAIASLDHEGFGESMQLTADARYLFRKNSNSIEFVDMEHLVPVAVRDPVGEPNAEADP